MSPGLRGLPAGDDAAAQDYGILERGIAAGRHHILCVRLDAEMAVDVETVGGFENRLRRSQRAALPCRAAELGTGKGQADLIRLPAKRRGIDKAAGGRGCNGVDATVGEADAKPTR